MKYPSPASPELIKSIQVYDAAGRIVTIHLVGGHETNLEVSAFSKGVYFLKIVTDKGIRTGKLAKE